MKKYRIEIYEDTFSNDPTTAFHADDPFPVIHVGDYISHPGWDVPPHAEMDGKTIRVKSLRHHLLNHTDGHYTLGVCVEAVPKPDEMS